MFKLKICAVYIYCKCMHTKCNMVTGFAYVLFDILIFNHICILFTDSILYDFF